jgi:DNA-binding beta-propeller fold protein YncE
MSSSSISVRGLAAIAALCALFCLGAASASASAAPLVWTLHRAEASVSTIDSGTGKVVGSSILVGESPNSIAITPNGRRAVVVNFGGASATVIETATRTPVKTISLAHNGEQVAISPDGKSAFVTDESDEEVQVIDPETAKLVGSFPVGPEASRVAFSPDGRSAYVGVAPEEIAVVETATEEMVGEPIAIGGSVTSIVLTPDGETAYATASGVKGVLVIDTALAEVVKTILTPSVPSSLAVSPDGRRLYISNATPNAVSVAETATDAIVGKPIEVPEGAGEIAITPDGKKAWVAGKDVTPINLVTEEAEHVALTGEIFNLVVAPDQSPTAAFTAPSPTAGISASFSGGGSTDLDGSIAAWSWAFGDGGTATGVGPSHTYEAPGAYNAKLSVVDNEGCGEEEVFTGRTAYCSGNVGASVTHSVTAKAPAVEPIATVAPSNKFTFGRLVHNRHNGTARLQVKLPGAGFVLLFGRKVHAVTRKSKSVQSMWLTIHARVELNKRLKKTLRAPVKIRVTFTPNGGTSKTVNRTVTLQRAPPHKHPGR